MTNKEAIIQRTKGFLEDRFGMFIHWGLYSIPSRGEWVRSNEKLTVEEYQQFFNEFNPVEYHPEKWAAAAKNAGMKYAVLTTKHHDGFCLFDSALTDYKATNTPAKRDLVREYVDAFRAAGLKVGFYYSLLDWHHPDYPKFGDACHPMRDNEAFRDEKTDFENYRKYLLGQIRELLTNYGKIDIIWFDFSYGEMTGEKWGAQEIVELARSLQPDIIIDNRLDGAHTIKSDNPVDYSGDFDSPEQFIPSEGVVDDAGNPLPWEACITMNDHWGYASSDTNYKPAKSLVRKLVECVSKGGNLLLNVGPDAKGRIPKPSLDILAEIGEWTRDNCAGIYGCGKADLPKPEWGYYTQKGDLLYAHVMESPIGPLAIKGLGRPIKKIRFIADGSERKAVIPWNAGSQGDTSAFIDVGFLENWPNNTTDTVFEIELG